jgi:hypothetical protein
VITTSTGIAFKMEMASAASEASITCAKRTFTGFGGTSVCGVTLITRVDLLESIATRLLGPLFRLLSAWVELDVCASEPSTNASVWLQSFASRTSLAVLSRRWLNAKVDHLLRPTRWRVSQRG